MPVMPFLSRRRSAFEVITANVRDSSNRDEAPQRPMTSGLTVPSSSTAGPPRPISIHGMAFTSSRLSHEVRSEDIPDSPTHGTGKKRSKRFSMLKTRNFSESQLSFRAQMDDDDDVPPMPALPSRHETPGILRTAPTTDMNEVEPIEGKAMGISFKRPASRKRDTRASTEIPRKSLDERERPKKSSLRWRRKSDKSTGLDDPMSLTAARAAKQPEAPPAYGDEDNTELALPVARYSESSRSDGSHASSSGQIYGSTTTTTHTVSTHTTFFRIPRRNKNRNSLFPLPAKLLPPGGEDGPATPSQDPSDVASPSTVLHRTNTSGSPSRRNTIIAAPGQSLPRRPSQRSRHSSTSSPLQPPMRLSLRNRASTTSSFGRGSIDTPPLPNGSTRNSTSTTGRSSLGGLLSLSRFRQDSDANSPGTRSKSNSFALSREALVVPEREEGDTPGRYLERLESTVSRSMIATILSKSADPFAQAVLRSYTRRFPFFGEPIDMSLRKFLLEAELPKETQQVDRVVQAFADRYHECNPGVFVNSDQAYIIAFSLMMLHTDAFNKNNKRKMQKQDYIKNTSGQRVSADVLGCFYDNICYTPFVHYEEEVDINGERVLPFKPKKIKMKATTADATKKPSGPVDPYNLLVEQKLDTLRPSIKDSIFFDDPYNYLGSTGGLDMKALQRAFTHTGVLQIISARSRPTAYEGHFNNSSATPVETEAGIISLKITKVGTLWRKAAKKKKARSPWQEWGAILTGSQLYLFKNAHWAKGLLYQFVSQQKPGNARVPVTFKPPLSDFKPDALIKTDDAVALVDSSYTRHKHSFTFVRHGGQEEVFLADSDSDRNDWLALINYAAAFRAAGVRIRGMLGVSDDDVRSSRRASATSTSSANNQIVDAETANTRRLDAQLSKQVITARRQVMMQHIVEADRSVASMTRQLDDLSRDARHLMVLAPIASKTREDVIFAAARADANIKWIRRDIWRVKAHRDIIALDVQEDGIDAAELKHMIDRVAQADKTLDNDTRPSMSRLASQRSVARSSIDAFTALSRSASVREAVDEFVDDVFRSPLENNNNNNRAAQNGSWRLPPLQLDVTEEDRQHHASFTSAMLAVPEQSSRRPSVSQTSAISQRPDMTAASVPAAVTPASSIIDTDTDVQTTRSVMSDVVTSPESSSKQRSVRRSLHKTLRDVQHHPGSIHRHRRGRESESTLRSGGGEGEEEEGTPGLERAKGRFILHGKQASVIEFGEDWPNERMKMRRDAWRNAPRTPRSGEGSRRQTLEDGQRSPVVQELVHDTTDDEDNGSDTTGNSTVQSFTESAELARQYAVVNISETSAGADASGEDDDEDDEDEPMFYDLSSWDPDVGKRDTSGEQRLDAINEQSDDGHDTTGESASYQGDRSHRGTVIGPSRSISKGEESSNNDDWLSKSFADTAESERVNSDSSLRSVRPHVSLIGLNEAARRQKDTEMLPLAGSRRGSQQQQQREGDDDDDTSSDAASAQAGVKRLEAISSTWSKSDLYIAYFGLSLVAFAMSLEGQTTTNLTVYATSAFNAHSLVSTVLVVQGVVLSVVKPLMSKIADVFGRSEAFTLSVLIYTIGYVQQAASSNVQTYAAAQIFYSAGQTGLQILIQIFIADTSDLVNRAVCATIPYTPYLINVWIGAPLADTLLHRLSWRWGYGIWAVVLPLAYIPLALALMVNQRRAAQKDLLPPSPFEGKTWYETATLLYYELDVVGLALLCAAFSFILIPLSLGSSVGWSSPSIIVLLVLGGLCLIAFPFWERNKRLAPRAFFPGSLFRQRTVLAGLGISFFYFMAYYLSVYPYFQSYLLVVQDKSVTTAGHIIQTWTFAATVTSICVSFLIKRFKRYRIFVTIGASIYLVGLVVMVFFRKEGAETWSLVGTQILVGMGGGMLNIPAQTGVQASASHAEVAAATAIFLTFLEVGGACGSAISGAIWSANIPKKLALYLPDETKDQADAIYRNITLASTGWPMGSPTRQAINRGYQETMTYILIVAVCASVPVIILSLLMEDFKLDEIEQGVKGVVIGGEVDSSSTDADEEREPFISTSPRRKQSAASDEESPMLGSAHAVITPARSVFRLRARSENRDQRRRTPWRDDDLTLCTPHLWIFRRPIDLTPPSQRYNKEQTPGQRRAHCMN